MALTDTAPDTETSRPEAAETGAPPGEQQGFDTVLSSTDHVVLGRILVGFSLFFLLADLVVAFLVLLDVAGDGVLDAALVARLIPNHLLGLLFCGAMPLLLGLGLLVVPAQVGSRSVAFPRAAAAGVWSWLLFSVLLVVAVAADGSYGGADRELSRLGNVATGGLMVSLTLVTICVVTTVIANRPTGLGLRSVPFFSFSMLAAGSVWLLSLPAAFLHVVLAHITGATPSTLLEATYGDGLSWLFRQPAVYAMAVPVLGLAIDAVAHLTGGRPRMRGLLQTMIVWFAFLAFGSWAQVGASADTLVLVVFALSAPLPVLVVLGALGDVARQGRPKLASPLAFVLGSFLLLLMGTLVGVLSALDTIGDGDLIGFDRGAMGTAQFYLVLGATLLGALGGLFYWARLAAGQRLPESAGRGVAPLATLGGLVLGLPIAIIGIATPSDDAARVLSGIACAGALIAALAVAGALAAWLEALRHSPRGDERLADPWGGGGTLEWIDGEVPDPVPGPFPLWEPEGAAVRSEEKAGA